MTTEVISQTIQAGVPATFGQGSIWYIKSASAALNITAERLGSGANVRRFTNVGAGFKFKSEPGEGWTYLRVETLVTQAVEIIIGDDDVDVANAVSVTGSVVTSDQPSAAIATPARQTVGNAASVTIPANVARKRITICNPSDNATPGLIYVQVPGSGAGRGYPLDPGLSAEFRTAAALAVRNDSGGSVDFTTFEET